MKTLRRWIKRMLNVPLIAFVWSIFQRFGSDNGAFYAAGLAFFLLLSFIPIVLTGVAILACFIDVHSASVKVTELIQGMLPAGGAREEGVKFLTVQIKLNEQVKSIIDHRGLAGLFGLLSLIWATVQIFINASVAMNAMWEVKETRNWFVQHAVALMLMLTTGSLIVLSLFLSGAPIFMQAHNMQGLRHPQISLTPLTVLSEFIALLVNAVMYVLIYRLLPNAKVSWQAATVGGVTASVLFEVAKKGVAHYLLKANHTIYGDLANLIVFVLWIYYSMTILLLGAEVSAAFVRLKRDLKARVSHDHATGRTTAVDEPIGQTPHLTRRRPV